MSSEYWDPLDSEDCIPQFSVSSQSQYLFETAQSFNFGEISTVQDRFQSLLKRRLQMEFENRPPLFPWESEIREYPVELPAFSAAQAVGKLWLDNLHHFKAANALPDAVLTKLLERCQIMAQTSLKEGVKLVRTVESFFPDHTELLEPIADMVLTPAYRSTEALEKETVEVIQNLTGGYTAAAPQQQVAISMLAAKEIMSALTLTVSPIDPQLKREWITAFGTLTLGVTYQGDWLLIEAKLPSGGQLHLIGDQSESSTSRPEAGKLSLVETTFEVGQTYTLEVSLSEGGQRPLRFTVGVVAGA
ncbi:MAG: PatU [Cyanobacteria bacterium P01_D01_bin.44]